MYSEELLNNIVHIYTLYMYFGIVFTGFNQFGPCVMQGYVVVVQARPLSTYWKPIQHIYPLVI